jgi:hypothetical protein
MGSAVHAKNLQNRNVKIKGMISLEMIGYFDDTWMSQDYPVPVMRLLYPNRGNFIALVGNMDQRKFVKDFKVGMKGTTDLEVYSLNAPPLVQGIDFSDHLNYWKYGWNALMVTDTSFNRNKKYHEKEDTWDKLDYERMSKVVVGVYEALSNL